MLTVDNVYYGKLFIEEKYDNMLADYGVIILGEYNKKLGCYENCLMSGIVNTKLMKLAQDEILGFDGTVIKGLKELSKLLK
jgi:hypothetical protein